jgi:hypothetical protein
MLTTTSASSSMTCSPSHMKLPSSRQIRLPSVTSKSSVTPPALSQRPKELQLLQSPTHATTSTHPTSFSARPTTVRRRRTAGATKPVTNGATPPRMRTKAHARLSKSAPTDVTASTGTAVPQSGRSSRPSCSRRDSNSRSRAHRRFGFQTMTKNAIFRHSLKTVPEIAT